MPDNNLKLSRLNEGMKEKEIKILAVTRAI
jgi:hypothetical protein